MKLDFPPRFSERIGAITLHAVQKIYELDSGNLPSFTADIGLFEPLIMMSFPAYLGISQLLYQ